METNSKQHELQELRTKVRDLEQQVQDAQAERGWEPESFYGAYYATTGFMLGIAAAAISLMVNVILAPMAGKNPLELIRVYLTFPLGEKALLLTDQAEKTYVLNDGIILAIGCCLYLGTGMLLGTLFQVMLAKLAGTSGLVKRLLVASVFSLVVWIVNFYLILSWLQPAVCGGNWITDSSVLPPWVAAGTHLVFGWAMAVLYPLGRFVPYKRPMEY